VRLLTVLLAFQQALWIDVPFIQQDKNGCGSASIWMVMKYWKPDTAADVTEIQQQLYSSQAGGIYAKDMAEYFESHGYRVFTFRGEWSDLTTHLSKGRPLIVCLERNSRGVPLHYVVVAGLDPANDLVLVNDPAQRKLLSMSRPEFERAWRATDNWTLLAVPELQLASAAFREENLSEARQHLTAALDLDPSNQYANEFLGTVFFLQNNIEAALKYWNRAGKPVIENVRIDPPVHTDAVLLDRTLGLSRGSFLRLTELEAAEAKLDSLRLFSRYRLELSPAADDRFDLTLRAAEKDSVNVWSWMAGLPFQTITPEVSNIGGKAINIGSKLRWDSNKRRAFISLETPLGGNPKWGVRVSVDGRDEIWTSTPDVFRMKKIQAGAELRAVPSGRWQWASGASVSTRHFSNDLPGGVELKYSGSVTRTLVRQPDRQIQVDSTMGVEAGKLWRPAPDFRFAAVTNTTSVRWRSLSSKIRLGTTMGDLPFDERFLIGLDRDSDLWMRAHPATVEGRKNAFNTSRKFVLTNSDFQKTIWNSGWFQVGTGPFLDTSKSSISSNWIVDTGIEVRVRVLGAVGLNFSYGKSLTDTHQTLFLRSSAP
jgi:tetratricopeptide (TPR) repeat protein